MPRRFGNVGSSGILIPAWKNSVAVTIACGQRMLSDGSGTSFGRLWTFDSDQETIINNAGADLQWKRKYGAGSSYKQFQWALPAVGVAFCQMWVDAGIADNHTTDPMLFYLNGLLQTASAASSSSFGTTPQIRTADVYIGNRAGLDRAWDGVFDWFAMWEVAQPAFVSQALTEGADPRDWPRGLIVHCSMERWGEYNRAPAAPGRIGIKTTWTGTSSGRAGRSVSSCEARRMRDVAPFAGTSPPPPPPTIPVFMHHYRQQRAA